ncbi:YcaO-like family protein [Alkalihalobacillus sp. NPDC078783]
METNSSDFLGINKIDYTVIEQLEAEVRKSKGAVYFVYDLLTKHVEKLTMFKYPQCKICGQDDSIRFIQSVEMTPVELPLLDGYRTKTFSETAKRLQSSLNTFFHPHFGLLPEHFRSVSDSMPLISAGGALGPRSYDAHGRNKTYRKAFFTSILEGLERLHGLTPASKTVVLESEQSLNEKAWNFVTLNQFIHFEERHYAHSKFNYKKYDTNNRIFWRNVYSLTNQEYVLAPEQIIYFASNEFYEDSQQQIYLSDSSNGTALGSNTIEASLGGLFELIERDAFLVHWYSKSSPLRLDHVDQLDSREINMMIAYLHAFGYEVHIFDITLESEVPTYWVLLELREDDDSKIAFYTTAGTNIDPVKALESALIEASTSIRAFIGYKEKKYQDKEVNDYINDYSKVEQLEDHLFLYSSKKMAFAFQFAVNTNRRIDAVQSMIHHKKKMQFFSSQDQLFNALIKKLSNYHDQILQANLTSESLRRFELNCVKIVVPSMQNVSFGYLYQNINRSRIKQAVQLNDLDGQTEVMNNEPHPFP